MNARQQFAVPQPYFVRDERETKQLEHEAAELRSLIADAATDWWTRENAASRLHEIERVLKTSELGRRLTEREARPAVHQHAAQQQAQPVHVLQCAPGFRAITEHEDGTGAILIIEDDGAAKK